MPYPLRACLVALSLANGCLSTEEPGSLVPPTADQDPRLPQIALRVAGRTRAVHLMTYGDPANPTLLVLHGSLADSRSYLALSALADRYFVVFWDQRGNGLSERIGREEFTWESVVEEIVAIKSIHSPARPVTLVGHSWGAVYAAMVMGRRPDDVAQAVLIEPFGLKGEFSNAVANETLNIFTHTMVDEVWFNDVLSPKDHESLDYKCLLVLKSAVRNYYCDSQHLPPLPVWRPGGYIEIRHNQMIMKGSSFEYDFTGGLDRYPAPVLLVGSECSTIGYSFQEKYHVGLFAQASVARVERAGHRLIVEQPDAVLAALRGYLAQSRSAP
jgi:proline iminopeptidase